MRRTSLVGVLTLALLGGTATPGAAAPDRTGRPSAPVYLALGDSVPAGAGARPTVSGYPERLDALLDDGYNPAADKDTGNASVEFDLTNRAVGGATTASFLTTQLPAAVALLEARNGNRNPLDDVEIVTLTIGGNDLFGPAVQNCVLDPTPTDCQAAVEGALAGTSTRLTEILRQLVAAAGPRAEVVVTTYYNPIGACFLAGVNPMAVTIGDVGLEGGELPGVLTLAGGLNDVIRQAAASAGAQVAELYGALDTSQYVGGRDCLHPNQAGHDEIAGVLYATLAG